MGLPRTGSFVRIRGEVFLGVPEGTVVRVAGFVSRGGTTPFIEVQFPGPVPTYALITPGECVPAPGLHRYRAHWAVDPEYRAQPAPALTLAGTLAGLRFNAGDTLQFTYTLTSPVA